MHSARKQPLLKNQQSDGWIKAYPDVYIKNLLSKSAKDGGLKFDMIIEDSNGSNNSDTETLQLSNV